MNEPADEEPRIETRNSGGANVIVTGSAGTIDIIQNTVVINLFAHPGATAQRGLRLWHRLKAGLPARWPRWLVAVLSSIAVALLVVAYTVALLVVLLALPYIVARRLEGTARNQVIGGYTAVLVVAVIALVGMMAPGPGPAAPTMCGYSWSVGAPGALPDRVPLATASASYTLAVHTSLGDITVRSLAADHPCAAYALRTLATQNFYDHQPCTRLETPAMSGFILHCYDVAARYPANGVRFSPDRPTGDEGGYEAVLMMAEPVLGQAAGLLAFGGNGLTATQLQNYVPCAQVIGGLDILRKVVDGGDTGKFYETGGRPKKPIMINYLGPVTSVR